MGRTIRFFFLALGSIASGTVFRTLPFYVFTAAYIMLSLLLFILFYLSGSLWRTGSGAAPASPEKDRIMENAARRRFTKRELDVLSCLIDGMSRRDIADFLHVSERTVKFHIANIYEKAGAKNRMELLVVLNRTGSPRGTARSVQ